MLVASAVGKAFASAPNLLDIIPKYDPHQGPSTSGIIWAAIEPNGWVLRVRLFGALSAVATSPDTVATWASNFAGYALAPNSASPALTLSLSSNGYVQSAGMAIASNAVQRSLVGTKVLRRPVSLGADGITRNAKVPDEVDNSDGTITVRIALSQYVYADDTNIALNSVANWRSGAMEAFGIHVFNYSTVPAPAPIVRWSDVPYQLQSRSFALECVVAAFHPNGLAPVAGVKFTVTDGTTVKTYWTTTLSTSNSYTSAAALGGGGTGQGLRVYSATVDPTTATALSKGLLRCDFEVYPWVGPVQRSDPAGTKAMTNLASAGLGTSASVPFVVAYNPGNSWIMPRYVNIDETNGTSVPANVTMGATQAAADAGVPAASIGVALNAIWAQNAVVAAANGQAAITRSADGVVLTLRRPGAAAGCTGVATGTGVAVAYGLATGATFVTLRGDPADPTQRACVLRAPPTNSPTVYPTLFRITGLSIEASATKVIPVYGHVWLDNFEYRGAIGQLPAAQPAFSGNAALWATNGKWFNHGSALYYFPNTLVPLIVRNVSVERQLAAPLIANCARLPTAVPGTQGLGAPQTLTDPGLALERIAVGNDLRYLNNVGSGIAAGTGGMLLANANDPSSGRLTLGTTYPIYARCAALNNVGEVYGSAATMWGSIGENATVAASECIVEGCTFAGDRVNNPYNDLNLATIALNDSEDVQLRLFRFANNVTLKNASKHDAFNDATVQAGRIGIGLPATRNKTYAAGAELVVAAFAGTASISGTTLTVTSVDSGAAGIGTVIIAGSQIFGMITGLISGSGGMGTYILSAKATLTNSPILGGGPMNPANIYHCATAGTTGGTGGPAGVSQAIGDGTATWQWVGTENRLHGYRPQAISAWASTYGVGYEGNIDLENANDPLGSPDFHFEFYGLGSQSLVVDGINLTGTPFTLDKSGTPNRQPYQRLPDGTGGGDYRPLPYGAGTYILGRGRSASIDVDRLGVQRCIPFAAGACESS